MPLRVRSKPARRSTHENTRHQGDDADDDNNHCVADALVIRGSDRVAKKCINNKKKKSVCNSDGTSGVSPKYTSKTTRLLYPGENFYIHQRPHGMKNYHCQTMVECCLEQDDFYVRYIFQLDRGQSTKRHIKHSGQTNNGPIGGIWIQA